MPAPPKRRMSPAEKWATGVGIVGAVVALVTWLFPQSPFGGPDGADQAAGPAGTMGGTRPAAVDTAAPAGRVTGTPPPGAGGSGATPGTPLHTLTPESGRQHLVALPRPLAGRPEYEGSVAIGCPSNQADDKTREVTFPLRGRYLDFAGTVRPYFTVHADARSYTFAIAGFRERDGTITRQQKGDQRTATMAAPGPLAAPVDGAETLTIQVQCEDPDGVIVLTGAVLTA